MVKKCNSRWVCKKCSKKYPCYMLCPLKEGYEPLYCPIKQGLANWKVARDKE